MADIRVKHLIVENLHGSFNYDITFNDDLNILFGLNGSGKTTILHILANILSHDIARLTFLNFSRVKASFSNNSFLEIKPFTDSSERKSYININAGFNDKDVYQQIFLKSELRESLESESEKSNYYPTGEDEEHPIQIELNNFLRKCGLTKINTSYFPAFRTMIEAWAATFKSRFTAEDEVNYLARKVFGKSTPEINYPYPESIRSDLINNYYRNYVELIELESRIFSDSFLKFFDRLIDEQTRNKPLQELVSSITEFDDFSKSYLKNIDFETSSRLQKLTQQVIDLASNIEPTESAPDALYIYLEAIQEAHLKRISLFSGIDSYLTQVNNFLGPNKKLILKSIGQNEIEQIRRNNLFASILFDDGREADISVLSSGERQIITMLWAVYKLQANMIILIDEPEISLHIDWQEELINNMKAFPAFKDNQIFICTHSPHIVSENHEFLIDISPLNSVHNEGRNDI